MIREFLAYLVLAREPTPAFMLDRYDTMLSTLAPVARNRAGEDESAPEHLRWMVEQLRTPMEPLQASRWLGWVHKGVCDLGLTTSMAERDFTRPHFKPIRERWGAIPAQDVQGLGTLVVSSSWLGPRAMVAKAMYKCAVALASTKAR